MLSRRGAGLCQARLRGADLLACTCLCLALSVVADAQQNPSFEASSDDASAQALPGWDAGGRDVDIAVDASVAIDGVRSLRVSGDTPGGVARVGQRLAPPAVVGNRLRFSAYIKTRGVEGSATLSLRIESAEGLLYVDGFQSGGATGTSDWSRFTVEAPVFATAAEVQIGLSLRGRGTAWFDDVRIEGFDTAALPPPRPAVARYVQRALDILQQNSVRRAAIDWPDFRARVMDQARGATTTEEAYLAVRYALGALGDHHSYLMTPDRAVALQRAPVANARTGRAAVPPRGERLDGDIAYLWLPGFAGGQPLEQVEFAENLQRTIKDLDVPGTCGWIVDLRDNTGGNVWPMLLGLGPLIGEGRAAAAEYPDGRRVPLWYREGRAGLGDYVQLRVRGEAYALRSPQPRIAVLLGRSTASSGEIMAAAFRGPPRHRSFGAPTRGLGTGNRTYDLSDGAALVLTVAATSDRQGNTFLGALQPDVITPDEDEDLSLAEQPAVRAAVDWLGTRCERSGAL